VPESDGTNSFAQFNIAFSRSPISISRLSHFFLFLRITLSSRGFFAIFIIIGNYLSFYKIGEVVMGYWFYL